ncbi:MAG: hypothetical protein AMJ46_13065 [Latescibacteria bacterium DG_63]|nr:MAG: hypothetical protein AMJ46_13065 [Latescibacteria bacterium DG_63]
MKSKLTANRCRRWVATTSAMVLVLTAVGTSADEMIGVNLKIERVALFKNGLGYFTSSAILPKAATTIKLGQLPVPSHGTFWVGYPEDVKVRALFTSMEDVEEAVPARSVAELLQVNPGREVAVSTGSEDMPTIRGTIVKAMPEDKPTEPPSPYLMDIRRTSSQPPHQPYRATSLVVIRTEAGTVALNAGSITRADFEDDDITTSVSVVSKQPSIRMELEKPAKGERIGVSYLARGITWSPSYMIDISDTNTARLSAKALVINEIADLHGVYLELVTGFPNIQFGEVNSPVAMSQNLEGFLKALTTGRSESRGRGHMMGQQAMLSNIARFEERTSAPMPGYSTAREGTVSEDLFLYPVENFALPRGETACIPLFTAEVPYKHIYIWKIPDMLDKDERYRRERERDEQLLAEEVWHSCRLVNNMKMPLTTATAEFVKDGQFTGQDICYYTAPGAETTIRINRAMNVLAQEAELELERTRNAATFHGYRYDLVKVRGELKLQNRLDKSTNVEVTKNLSGEVLETIPQAKDVPTAKGLKQVNPRHVLVWEIELKPGEKQTLSYTHEVYVRN